MELTAQERELLAQSQALAITHLAPNAAWWSHSQGSNDAILPLAAAVGLLGLQVPAAQGGRGMSFRCKAQAAEILAAADFGVAMSIINTHNVAEQLARLAAPALVQKWVPELIAGSKSACTALTEPGTGSDFAAIQTTARQVPGGWQLDGVKSWITNAAHADAVVVYAQTRTGAGADGIAAFVVDASRSGFERVPQASGACAASLGVGGFRLHAYRCSEDEMLCPPGQAFKDILGAINGARTYVAAMCCGMVGEALRIATAFGKQRHTFGKPLLAHQGWRWQLADAAIDLEAARLLVQNASALIDGGHPAHSAAAKAKVFATRMAQKHIAALLHAMGAEGLSDHCPLARHLAAAQVATLVDGSTEMLLERIAKDFKSN